VFWTGFFAKEFGLGSYCAFEYFYLTRFLKDCAPAGFIANELQSISHGQS